jgi:hypothetical protein
VEEHQIVPLRCADRLQAVQQIPPEVPTVGQRAACEQVLHVLGMLRRRLDRDDLHPVAEVPEPFAGFPLVDAVAGEAHEIHVVAQRQRADLVVRSDGLTSFRRKGWPRRQVENTHV